MPQVIRLPLPSVTFRSSDMTQQQRVAAALVRASVTNPAGWTDSSVAPDCISVRSSPAAIAEPPTLPTTYDLKRALAPENPARFSLQRNLLLFGGALLALTSAYLFLHIR